MRVSSLMCVIIFSPFSSFFLIWKSLFFPWATILREIAASESIRLFGFFEMIVFLGILLLGYVYVWKKGALDWE